MAECPVCLAKVKDEARFCNICGAAMDEAPVGRERRNMRNAIIAGVAIVAVAAVAGVSYLGWGAIQRAQADARVQAAFAAELKLQPTDVANLFAKAVIAGHRAEAAHLCTTELAQSLTSLPPAEKLLGPGSKASYVLGPKTDTVATCTLTGDAQPYIKLTRGSNQPWRVAEVGYQITATNDENVTVPDEERDDPTLADGETKVAQEGHDGVTKVTIRTDWVNGVSRRTTTLANVVVTPAVAHVVLNGTKTQLTRDPVTLGPVGGDPQYGAANIGKLSAHIVATDVRTDSDDNGKVMVVRLDVQNTGSRPFDVIASAGYKLIRMDKSDWEGYWGNDRSIRYSDKAPGFGLQGSYKTTKVYSGDGSDFTFGQDANNSTDDLVVWPGKSGTGFFIVYFGESDGYDSSPPPTPNKGEDFVVGLQLEKNGYDESDSKYSASETRRFLMPMSHFWTGPLP